MTDAQPPTCRNCSAALRGRYCSRCGQDSRDPPGTLGALLRFFASRATGLESKAGRTFATLLVRPGRLTRDYLDGRRTRYSGPVQLYLWCTAAFFLLHAYHPVVRMNPETGSIVSTLSSVSVGTRVSAETVAELEAQGSSLAAFQPRFDAVVSAYLPVMLVGLVAASAGVMAVLFRREGTLAHAIFALHWTSFYFVAESVRRLAPLPDGWQIHASIGLMLVRTAYLTVAMRTVYGRGWWGNGLRAFGAILLFSLLLALWLSSTVGLAERLA